MSTEKKPSYSPGLEGVIAGESSICWVDPNAGLMYRGYDVHDLAEKASFEEVAWLLMHAELPTREELEDFRRDLAQARALPGAVLSLLDLMPKKAHPMDILRTGVSMLGAFDPDLNDHSHESNLRKAGRLIARVSTTISSAWRIAHNQKTVEQKADLAHAENFLHQFTGETPPPWKAEMFNSILIMYAEHDFNASTFSARVTASTMADMYAAITTALGTLKGPLHGGANEESMKMLRQIGTASKAEAWLMARLAKKEKIMGFGHRVYKKGDSRVPLMREFARQLGKRFHQEEWAPICEKLEEVMEREKHLCANVDLYAAPVFHLMGLEVELNTPIFALARISGWCAHVIEQHDHNRLIRPRSLYTGPQKRRYHALGSS